MTNKDKDSRSPSPNLFLTGVKSHLRKTVKKILPSQETIAKLQNTKVSISVFSTIIQLPYVKGNH